MENKAIVLHWPGGASGIQFFLEEWHELTQVCLLDENMKPYSMRWSSEWVCTLISITQNGVQELVSPSDYVMRKY